MLKDIEGFEGLYAITDDGRVWSYPKYKHNGKWLKPILQNNGYLSVTLHKDNKAYIKAIHRLIAETFIQNPNNYPTIDHINRCKTDNRIENLR